MAMACWRKLTSLVKVEMAKQIDKIADCHPKDHLASDELKQYAELVRLCQQHRDCLIACRIENRDQSAQRKGRVQIQTCGHHTEAALWDDAQQGTDHRT